MTSIFGHYCAFKISALHNRYLCHISVPVHKYRAMPSAGESPVIRAIQVSFYYAYQEQLTLETKKPQESPKTTVLHKWRSWV